MIYLKTAAVLLAAGQGRRMNNPIPKQYLLLKEKPVLYYSLKTLEESMLDEIILITNANDIEYCKNEIIDRYQFQKVKKIICGGKERYYSVYNGLNELKEVDYVWIHDGARPFLTNQMILDTFQAVQQYRACVIGMPVKDTIKIVNENKIIQETPPRETIWSVQTPQVFEFSLIKKAYDKFIKEKKETLQITDDAMLIEQMTNCDVKLVQGDYHNIKITTPEDLIIAETFLSNLSNLS